VVVLEFRYIDGKVHGQSFFVDGVYILWGYAHIFAQTYGWGKPRSKCLYKCTGVGRTRVGGHETRPKPKPNVDYYLVSYLLLLLLLLNVYKHN